jgi:hypothetical protein
MKNVLNLYKSSGLLVSRERENGLIKKVGSSMGGLKLGKRAGDGPKWWNHENDSSAARSGAAHCVYNSYSWNNWEDAPR